MPDYVAALKGKMGDWVYYVTAMKLGKVAKETQLAGQIHKSSDLNSEIQREIGNRVQKEMVPYLLNQSQRFYGALIVAVYGGNPEFQPVKVAEHELINDNDKTSYGFGLLRFDGSQVYYALDGQHRLRSIQLAVEQDPALRDEEVAVIIVGHENTAEGMERTRRLFSTLNRKAEKTKVGLNIAIDEDDAVAICTRRLVYEHPYLGGLGMVKASKEGINSKQISTAAGNEPYLTTLQALYEMNCDLLTAFTDGTSIGMDVDGKFKANRPNDDDLNAYYTFLSNIWTDICEDCPDLKPVLEKKRKAGSLRIPTQLGGGGSIIARPLGQFIMAEVISAALRQGHSQKDFISRFFQEVSCNLDDVPWVKLIWNPESRTIMSGNAARALAVNLLLHKFNLKGGPGPRQLLREYRELTQDKKMKLLRASAPDEEVAEVDDNLTLL